MSAPRRKKNYSLTLMAIFLIFSLAIVGAGYDFYRNQKRQLEKVKVDELQAVANLKVEEIVRWRQELEDGARVFSASPFLRQHWQHLIRFQKTMPCRQEVVEWLQAIKNANQCHSVVLLDRRGKPILASSEQWAGLYYCDQELITEVIRKPRVLFSDFYYNPMFESLGLSLLTPILERQGDQTIVQGMILFRIDPTRSLFPMIQTWPTPSNTAETLLCRREGDDVVFLNELRHLKVAPYSLWLPIGAPDFPAGLAASGREGVIWGRDYRNSPVLAVMRRIPGSPWFLVAKEDRQEIFAGLHNYALGSASLAGVMILAAGLALVLLWRRQHLEFLLQTALLEAEQAQKLDAILSATPDQIYRFDKEGRCLYANRAAGKAWGIDQESLAVEKIQESRLLAANGRRLAQGIAEVGQSGRSREGEISLSTLHGMKYYNYILTPLTNPHISEISVLATLRDITDRKRAEENLRQTEELLQSILNHAPVPIYVKNRDSDYIMVNPAWEAFTGKSLAEVKGRNLHDVYPPAIAIPLREHDWNVISSGQPEQSEEVFIIAGETYSFQTIKFPLCNDRGEITAVVGISIDITEKKLAEKRLRDSLREKEVLLKEIHHRVKNNMQIISSLLRLQSGKVVNPEVQNVFQESQNRIRSMALVHEMLYQSPDLARINFTSYLETLIQGLRRSFQIDPQQITLQLEAEELNLEVDQALSFGLIINELVSNALKYAFPEGRRGVVCITVQKTSDQEVELVVRDDGVGLPPDLDIRNTTSLGLRLVQLLTGQLEGLVGLDQTNGTEFSIRCKAKDHG
ncbi:MAG TPA: hypothetical protein DCY27_07435 [Desulfobacterales bacterium]|nr:hypothetical protein [Desulfobacterales bacterium]